jgi:hypothetical protein
MRHPRVHRPSGRDRRAPRPLAIAWRAYRQVRVGSAVLALVFGASAYATATAYATSYPTDGSRREAAALVSGDAGLRILLGPITDIATVGGYLVYKNFVFLTTIGASGRCWPAPGCCAVRRMPVGGSWVLAGSKPGWPGCRRSLFHRTLVASTRTRSRTRERSDTMARLEGRVAW